MSFIAKHIANPDERLVYLARLHWIYFLQGLSWFGLFLALGAAADIALGMYAGAGSEQVVFGFDIGSPAHWFRYFMNLTGIMIFVLYLLKLVASEIALTDRRVIYKTGLIFTQVIEIDLHEVRSETVHHGLLGRVLDYGSLRLDSRFVDDVNLPAISRPYRFLRVLHKIRGHTPVTDSV